MDLLGGKGRAVQLEKAVDAVRQRGAVELVGGGKQRLFQLAVEGAGGLQLTGDALLSRRVQRRQCLPQGLHRFLRGGAGLQLQ